MIFLIYTIYTRLSLYTFLTDISFLPTENFNKKENLNYVQLKIKWSKLIISKVFSILDKYQGLANH